jgi:hypothetical protein
MVKELIHKYCKTKTPFVYVTFKDTDVDRILEQLVGDKDKFKCVYCQEEISKKELGGIMPDKNGLPIFLCRSTLCMFEYMEDFLEEVEVSDNDVSNK